VPWTSPNTNWAGPIGDQTLPDHLNCLAMVPFAWTYTLSDSPYNISEPLVPELYSYKWILESSPVVLISYSAQTSTTSST